MLFSASPGVHTIGHRRALKVVGRAINVTKTMDGSMNVRQFDTLMQHSDGYASFALRWMVTCLLSKKIRPA